MLHFLPRKIVKERQVWLIVHKETDAVLGYATLDIPYEQLGIGEIGYVIAENIRSEAMPQKH